MLPRLAERDAGERSRRSPAEGGPTSTHARVVPAEASPSTMVAASGGSSRSAARDLPPAGAGAGRGA